MSDLLPVLNIDFTIFNIFCKAFLYLLWYISQLFLTDLHRNIPLHNSISPFFWFFTWLFYSYFSAIFLFPVKILTYNILAIAIILPVNLENFPVYYQMKTIFQVFSNYLAIYLMIYQIYNSFCD